MTASFPLEDVRAWSVIPLGPQPDDLVDVLCDLALAGPGVCALRALRRVGTELDASDSKLLSAAARIAPGFRSLFNIPETIAMLRGSGEDSRTQYSG